MAPRVNQNFLCHIRIGFSKTCLLRVAPSLRCNKSLFSLEKVMFQRNHLTFFNNKENICFLRRFQLKLLSHKQNKTLLSFVNICFFETDTHNIRPAETFNLAHRGKILFIYLGSISSAFYKELLRQSYTNRTGAQRRVQNVRVENIFQPCLLVKFGVFLLVKLNGAYQH